MYARQGSRIGKLTMDPDSYREVKLQWVDDGSESGNIKAAKLTRLTAVEIQVCLCVRVCVCLSACLPVRVFLCVSVSLCLFLSVFLSVCLRVTLCNSDMYWTSSSVMHEYWHLLDSILCDETDF